MRVFVTGASGFIGSALVRELITAGHEVIGLVRTAEAATALASIGAQPLRGTLTDLGGLTKAASDADGVVHLAYMHGLGQIPLPQRLSILFGGSPAGIVSRFVRTTALADQRAIDALGEGMRDSGRPLVTTFGTLGLATPGLARHAPATEADLPDPRSPGFGRALAERHVDTWAERGVRAMIVRLAPTVHGPDDAGFVSQLAKIARARKVAGYPGDGQMRWPAVHRADAARLFRLALERGQAGARYHGVAETGITQREIAEAIANRLAMSCHSIPTQQATRHFGWLAPFVSVDNATSAERTQAMLGWKPQGPGLLRNLKESAVLG